MIARLAGLVVVGAMVGVFWGEVAALSVVAVLVSFPWWQRQRAVRTQRRALPSELAGLLEVAARAIRSGSTLHDALIEACERQPGYASQLVTDLSDRMTRDGHDYAVTSWVSDFDGDAVRIVAAVIGLVSGSHGGAARGLEAGAGYLREHDRIHKSVHAGLSQARASAGMLITIPLGVGVIAMLSSRNFTTLAAQPLIGIALGVGLVCEGVGGLWARQLVRSATKGSW